jgi:hypothetical protein
MPVSRGPQSLRKVSLQRVKVYQLYLETRSVNQVAILIGIKPSSVVGHMKALVRDNYLAKIKRGIYEKGTNSKLLDAKEYPAVSLINDGCVGVPSLKANSPQLANSPPPALEDYANAHFYMVKAKVDVESVDISKLSIKGADGKYRDVPFLVRECKGMRGMRQWYTGERVSIDGAAYSFRLQKNKDGSVWLFTWLRGLLTREEMLALGEGALDKIAQDQGLSIFNYVQKWGGWRLGNIQYGGNSKPHIVPEGNKIEAVRKALGPDAPTFEGAHLHIDKTPKRPDNLSSLEFGTVGELLSFEDALDNLPMIEVAARSGSYGVYLLQGRMSEADERLRVQERHIIEQDHRIERLEASIPRKPKEGEGREIA